MVPAVVVPTDEDKENQINFHNDSDSLTDEDTSEIYLKHIPDTVEPFDLSTKKLEEQRHYEEQRNYGTNYDEQENFEPRNFLESTKLSHCNTIMSTFNISGIQDLDESNLQALDESDADDSFQRMIDEQLVKQNMFHCGRESIGNVGAKQQRVGFVPDDMALGAKENFYTGDKLGLFGRKSVGRKSLTVQRNDSPQEFASVSRKSVGRKSLAPVQHASSGDSVELTCHLPQPQVQEDLDESAMELTAAIPRRKSLAPRKSVNFRKDDSSEDMEFTTAFPAIGRPELNESDVEETEAFSVAVGSGGGRSEVTDFMWRRSLPNKSSFVKTMEMTNTSQQGVEYRKSTGSFGVAFPAQGEASTSIPVKNSRKSIGRMMLKHDNLDESGMEMTETFHALPPNASIDTGTYDVSMSESDMDITNQSPPDTTNTHSMLLTDETKASGVDFTIVTGSGQDFGRKSMGPLLNLKGNNDFVEHKSFSGFENCAMDLSTMVHRKSAPMAMVNSRSHAQVAENVAPRIGDGMDVSTSRTTKPSLKKNLVSQKPLNQCSASLALSSAKGDRSRTDASSAGTNNVPHSPTTTCHSKDPQSPAISGHYDMSQSPVTSAHETIIMSAHHQNHSLQDFSMHTSYITSDINAIFSVQPQPMANSTNLNLSFDLKMSPMVKRNPDPSPTAAVSPMTANVEQDRSSDKSSSDIEVSCAAPQIPESPRAYVSQPPTSRQISLMEMSSGESSPIQTNTIKPAANTNMLNISMEVSSAMPQSTEPVKVDMPEHSTKEVQSSCMEMTSNVAPSTIWTQNSKSQAEVETSMFKSSDLAPVNMSSSNMSMQTESRFEKQSDHDEMSHQTKYVVEAVTETNTSQLPSKTERVSEMSFTNMSIQTESKLEKSNDREDKTPRPEHSSVYMNETSLEGEHNSVKNSTSRDSDSAVMSCSAGESKNNSVAKDTSASPNKEINGKPEHIENSTIQSKGSIISAGNKDENLEVNKNTRESHKPSPTDKNKVQKTLKVSVDDGFSSTQCSHHSIESGVSPLNNFSTSGVLDVSTMSCDLDIERPRKRPSDGFEVHEENLIQSEDGIQVVANPKKRSKTFEMETSVKEVNEVNADESMMKNSAANKQDSVETLDIPSESRVRPSLQQTPADETLAKSPVKSLESATQAKTPSKSASSVPSNISVEDKPSTYITPSKSSFITPNKNAAFATPGQTPSKTPTNKSTFATPSAIFKTPGKTPIKTPSGKSTFATPGKTPNKTPSGKCSTSGNYDNSLESLSNTNLSMHVNPSSTLTDSVIQNITDTDIPLLGSTRKLPASEVKAKQQVSCSTPLLPNSCNKKLIVDRFFQSIDKRAETIDKRGEKLDSFAFPPKSIIKKLVMPQAITEERNDQALTKETETTTTTLSGESDPVKNAPAAQLPQKRTKDELNISEHNDLNSSNYIPEKQQRNTPANTNSTDTSHHAIEDVVNDLSILDISGDLNRIDEIKIQLATTLNISEVNQSGNETLHTSNRSNISSGNHVSTESIQGTNKISLDQTSLTNVSITQPPKTQMDEDQPEHTVEMVRENSGTNGAVSNELSNTLKTVATGTQFMEKDINTSSSDGNLSGVHKDATKLTGINHDQPTRTSAVERTSHKTSLQNVHNEDTPPSQSTAEDANLFKKKRKSRLSIVPKPIAVETSRDSVAPKASIAQAKRKTLKVEVRMKTFCILCP